MVSVMVLWYRESGSACRRVVMIYDCDTYGGEMIIHTLIMMPIWDHDDEQLPCSFLHFLPPGVRSSDWTPCYERTRRASRIVEGTFAPMKNQCLWHNQKMLPMLHFRSECKRHWPTCHPVAYLREISPIVSRPRSSSVWKNLGHHVVSSPLAPLCPGN